MAEFQQCERGNVLVFAARTLGGGTIAKSDDGLRCVVAGRESLRILRLSDPEDVTNNDHKASVGRGGHRIEASRNIWDGSGLKIDSASTDVAWCHGSYNNKILTSARNGDLIMWDLNRAGNAKYERKTKFHIRSIHKLSCSTIVPYYCVTGSADGDMRVWDLRDMSKSIMKIHHPTSVRSLVFSPCLSHPLQAVVGLDNGSIYRWDLQMGQRGQLDRLPVAHTGPILALDWRSTPGSNNAGDVIGADRSWIVSGGLDHTVWDLATSGTSVHIAHQPTYTLHPSFPVRRVLWRPEFPSEIALVSNEDFGGGSGSELFASPRLQSATPAFINASSSVAKDKDPKSNGADAVEIWDVRRGWIAKWTVEVSVSEGGCDRSVRPIDAVPRVTLSWNVGVDGDTDGTLAFVSDRRARWEVPYDDIHPDKRRVLSERKLKLKCLGDKPRMPVLQTMGMYVRGGLRDTESGGSFEHLARKYLVESDGRNKTAVCKVNAEASIEAGSAHTAQVWLLLGSLLTDVIPEYISSSPHSEKSHQITMHLTHSTSAPAAIPTLSTRSGPHASGSTSKPTSYRAASSDSVSKMIQQTRPTSTSTSPAQPRISSQAYSQPRPEDKRSTSNNSSGTSASREREGERDALPTTKPPPNSRNLTPASSTSSSPRHIPTSLPPAPALPPSAIMTPATTRRPSVLISTAAQAQAHVRPPEAFEEEAEFLELLAKSFANAHDLRFKIAFADALTRLLRPIGKTAQAEVIHIDTVEGARARSSILPNGLLDCDARENSSELDRLQHHHDQDKKIWRCAFLSFIQASFQQPLKVAVDCRAMIDAAASRHHPSIVHLAGLSTLSRRLPSGTSRAPGSADKERYNQVKDDMNSIDRWYLWIKILCLISAAVLSSNLVENIHELLRTMSTTRCLFSGFSQLLEDLNDVYFLPFHDDVRSKSGSLGSSGCSRRQACLRSAVAHIYFLIAPQLQHHGSPAKQDAISYYVLKFIRNMETSFLVTAENRDDYALQRLCLRTRMRLFTGFSEEWCQGIQSESAKQRYILMQRAAAANDPQAESDSAERLSTRDLTTL
ncbi:hypothetical protein C8R48DRAFT_782829 [Suillus tomentosus]|nr:hypothetical protein C8R48DRAFT_782829 [Suillus tomentosus]